MHLKYALAAALTLLPLGAADFWQAKKFTEWNEKQCKRILEDSPWARQVTLSDDTTRRSRKGGGMADSSSPRKRGADQGGAPPEAAPTVMAIIRWHTALPMKQAIARSKFGDAAATTPEAVQMLNRKEDRYVVGVANLPSSSVPAAPDEVKPNVRIKVKGKPDIMLENVQAQRQGRRTDLFLFFPKGRDGAPVIELNDEEVELEVSLPDLKINRKFKLKEMVFDGKLEI